MKPKIVNRNIKFDTPERQATSSYKCAYKDKNTFDVLEINIRYNNEERVYHIESQYLKETSKSIHFDAFKSGDSFDIIWKPKSVAPYIKRIK